jgi:hypothetical protein
VEKSITSFSVWQSTDFDDCVPRPSLCLVSFGVIKMYNFGLITIHAITPHSMPRLQYARLLPHSGFWGTQQDWAMKIPSWNARFSTSQFEDDNFCD